MLSKPVANLLSAAAFAAALAGLWASPVAAKEAEIVAVVKISGIPWFNRFEEGVKQAGADLHVKAVQVGPAQADPAQQVKIIEDLIAKGVDAIVVVPNDAKVLEPVFERARAKGIVVVTHESPDQKGADWDVETIDNKKFAEEVFQKFADLTGGKGGFGLFVGGLTVPLHNYWADTGLAYLKAKYPDLKPVVDRLPVGESLDNSFKATQDLLKAHPDLKGIVGFGSQGPIAAAHVLQLQGLVGKVAVVGTVLPKQATPYLKDGALNAGFLWDPKDAGYAAVAVAKKVLDKQPIEPGFSLPELGKAEVDPAKRQIKFDQIKTFTANNAASFGF